VGVIRGYGRRYRSNKHGNDVDRQDDWLRIKRVAIMLLASVYAGNTVAELGDMIGIITGHPTETRSVSRLTSSFAIWIINVLTFSLLCWQVDVRAFRASYVG
jgi:hypothetical protein